MFGMFGMDSGYYRRQQAQRVIKSLEVEPWDPAGKWQQYARYEADTFKPPFGHFDEQTVSPEGTWTWKAKALPAGCVLQFFQGAKTGGYCGFDADIDIVQLVTKHEVWMSYTPMEVFTLRGGTRLAKGDVIIGGLGMGYQLYDIAKRTKRKRNPVTRIRVVEKSQELVDWLWPTIEPHLDGVEVEIIVGDARKIIPTLTADVAITDIDPGYGWNTFPHCPNIKRNWVWGSAKTP